MSTIKTLGGLTLDYNQPEVGAICIRDIGRSLSRLPRFCGHTDEFYSVAQHSYYVSWLVRLAGGDMEEQLVGLLHDAPEAYTGDVPTPLKKMLPMLRWIEWNIWLAVSEKYANGRQISQLVKACDRQMLAIECRQLRDHEDVGFFPEVDRSLPTVNVNPVTGPQSAELFLETFEDLTVRSGEPI